MYSLLPAFVSALFLALGIYVLTTEGRTRVSVPFVVMCATTFAWQGIWAFLFQTNSADTAALLVKVGYLFILFLPTTFYHFVIEMVSCRSERSLLQVSYVLCAFLAILLATGNEVIDGFWPHFFGDYPRAGRLHPIHVAQTVLLAGRTGWLLVSARRRTHAPGPGKLLDLCLLSLGLYSLAASDYAVNYGYAFYPLGGIFIAISLGILAVSIVRYGLMGPDLELATMAHEIATPLATIGMHADELRAALPELMRGYRLAVQHQLCDDMPYSADELDRLPSLATAIRRQVSSMSTVMEMSLASLTLHRLDKRSFAAHSVTACVESALERFPFRSGERELVSIANVDPTVQFSGSDSLLVFVLFNLLKNALHAIHPSGKGHIVIGAHRRDGFCVLRFSDSGPGIAPDVLPEIFEPFYSTKAHGSGSGVGLTFCRRACEALGGNIECESIAGVHTTFTLRLPEPGSAADRALHELPRTS
ncbi:ATP-binding protein [Paraburkholderia bryophila]|uniref:sensor histidine kinase n=1 Tax=Paraburkholderia bryophila TaxID=420952 RepID=UPI00234989C6|nr:sensor histidine kinase [Paraburkholderia bryophila]WCM18726.1 ATP-binding protein [Paraburkholderia bryophila]